MFKWKPCGCDCENLCSDETCIIKENISADEVHEISKKLIEQNCDNWIGVIPTEINYKNDYLATVCFKGKAGSNVKLNSYDINQIYQGSSNINKSNIVSVDYDNNVCESNVTYNYAYNSENNSFTQIDINKELTNDDEFTVVNNTRFNYDNRLRFDNNYIANKPLTVLLNTEMNVFISDERENIVKMIIKDENVVFTLPRFQSSIKIYSSSNDIFNKIDNNDFKNNIMMIQFGYTGPYGLVGIVKPIFLINKKAYAEVEVTDFIPNTINTTFKNSVSQSKDQLYIGINPADYVESEVSYELSKDFDITCDFNKNFKNTIFHNTSVHGRYITGTREFKYRSTDLYTLTTSCKMQDLNFRTIINTNLDDGWEIFTNYNPHPISGSGRLNAYFKREDGTTYNLDDVYHKKQFYTCQVYRKRIVDEEFGGWKYIYCYIDYPKTSITFTENMETKTMFNESILEKNKSYDVGRLEYSFNIDNKITIAATAYLRSYLRYKNEVQSNGSLKEVSYEVPLNPCTNPDQGEEAENNEEDNNEKEEGNETDGDD